MIIVLDFFGTTFVLVWGSGGMLRLCIVGHCTECYSTAQFEKNDADTMFFAMWLHSCRRAKCEKMVASPVLADQKLL